MDMTKTKTKTKNFYLGGSSTKIPIFGRGSVVLGRWSFKLSRWACRSADCWKL